MPNMPEGIGDTERPSEGEKYRESPALSFGLKKPAPYPIREMVYTTDDEAYQFRQPNEGYNDGSVPNHLPDGLQSDGTPQRHYGEIHVSHEDNMKELRQNDSTAHPGFASVQNKIEGEGYSKKSAGAILANASRHASKSAHKANPRLNRVKG